MDADFADIIRQSWTEDEIAVLNAEVEHVETTRPGPNHGNLEEPRLRVVISGEPGYGKTYVGIDFGLDDIEISVYGEVDEDTYDDLYHGRPRPYDYEEDDIEWED